MLRAYCELCGTAEVETIVIEKDELNDKPWGDLVCKCGFVIATFSADVTGKVVFVPDGDKT